MTSKLFSSQFYEAWKRKPEKPAVYLLQNNTSDITISYDKLMQGGAGYAQVLKDNGINPGEVVIIILNHSEDLLFAFWGTIFHGAIPAIMPFLTEKLSPEHYRQSLISLIEISAPAAIITFPEFLSEVDLALKSINSIGHSVRVTITTIEIYPHTIPTPFTLAGINCQPEDIVLLQHSSGSTGLQKGVALSHQSVFNQLDSYTKAISLSEQDIIVSWLPLYHDMGLIAGFILPILSGVPLVLMSPFDWVRSPVLLLQAVTKYKGTLTWLPNFAFNFCARKIRTRDLENVDLSSWRAVINCSEPMDLNSHKLFQERFTSCGLRSNAISTCYAMAENVFGVSQCGIGSTVKIDSIDQTMFMNEHKAQPANESMLPMYFLSAGKPIENVRVKILSDDHKTLPDRSVGEIAIKSNCMLKEYYHRPDLTQTAFFEGWFLTGDLGYIADGEIFITGRKKDIIIVGGKNIYPQDLERLADQVEGIHPGRVAAFGVFNQETGTEDIILVAELDYRILPELANYEIIADKIRLKVNQGSDISVRKVKLVPQGWLLKTSSGKVARAANKEKYLGEFMTGL